MVILSQYVEIASGFPFKSSLFINDSTQITLVKGENLQPGYIDWGKSKYWPSIEYEELKKYHLLTNDIVLAMDRPWVPAGLKWTYIKKDDPKALLVQRVARLRTKDYKLLSQFYLRYVIGSPLFKSYIDTIITGINVPHISGKQIGNFKFKLFDIIEQKKIAAILATYDDLIDVNKKRIKILEDTATELYKEWFVRFRFPNWQNTKFEKGIPADWNEVNLESFCKVVMGQSPKSEYYNEDGVGLPFHQGVGTYGELFPINRTYCSVSGRTAYKNDILFSVRAPVGRLNIANTKMTIGRGLSAFSSLDGYNDYLYYLLRHSFNKEDIIGNGAIFNSVTKNELLGFKILFPSENLIKIFDELANNLNLMIKTLYKKNENLSFQKNSLLPKLMSGKLSVAELDVHYPPSMQTDNETTDK